MLWPIVSIVVALIVVLAVVIAMQKPQFQITRAATISASPEKVFPLVNDFHHWEHWSPWAKLDPSMEQVFEGATAGDGAVYSWSGNGKVGAGRMTVTESRAPQLVVIRLEFLKPFKTTNRTEFTFTPQGSGTLVNWTMTGEKNFVSKAFGLIMDMDKLIGRDFEKGLAQMKAAAESGIA